MMPKVLSTALAALGAAAPSAALAQGTSDARVDIGIRGVLLLGKGQPANDMMGEGVIVRWRVKDVWRIGVAYDTVTFDYETPNNALGIVSATVTDGTNDLSRTSAFLERRYATQRRWDPYWLVGVGFASVDAPNVMGTAVGGGPFDIVTDADDEIHVFAGGGLRRALGARWTFDATFTVEHHTTDYAIVDRISGARGAMGSHSPYGIAVGLSYNVGSRPGP